MQQTHSVVRAGNVNGERTLYGSHVVSGFALGSTPDGVTSTMQLNTECSGPARRIKKARGVRVCAWKNDACESGAVLEDDHGDEGDVIKEAWRQY